MKTAEDKFNEALRDVLKRKFDDYEEQPNPGAYARIRARLKPSRGWKYWWLTGPLLLITLSGLLMNWYLNESNAPFSVSNDKKAPVTSPVNEAPERVTAHERAAAMESDRGIASVETHSEAASRINAASRHKAPGRKELPVPVTDKKVNVFGKRPDRKPATGSITGVDRKVEGAAISQSRISSARRYDRAEGPQQGILDYDIMSAALPETIPEAVDSAENAFLLNELAGMPLTEAPIPLHLRNVVSPTYKPAKAIVTNPARIAWLFNVSALHSYQILTVPSSAAKDFQNFSFPSLFTARSMGYKFSGGAERKGIQVQLHYSHFRQTYSYEIANNNYLVKPDEKGEYHTVRQGDRMEEDRRFSMLGIGIARQLRWGHSPVSRFYAAFGLEYSHALNTRQSLGWVSLGLGKQFAVSRNTAFSIGPYAEFSPVKVKGFANPFYYQPYRVGISAGLRFVKP